MRDEKYELIKVDDVVPSPWRATYIIKTDLRLLANSIHRYGWISPVVLRRDSGSDKYSIIDGHERVALCSENRELLVYGEFVPAKVLTDLPEIESMLMHVSINRARGSVLNAKLSRIIRDAVFSGAHDADSLMAMLSMTKDEFQVLLDGSLVKMRKISEHSYSKAWVPIEADADERPQFERPPNKDS